MTKNTDDPFSIMNPDPGSSLDPALPGVGQDIAEFLDGPADDSDTELPDEGLEDAGIAADGEGEEPLEGAP